MALEGLSPISTFPADQPYVGSVFYFAHTGAADSEWVHPFGRYEQAA